MAGFEKSTPDLSMNKSYPPRAFTRKINIKCIDEYKIADIHLARIFGERENITQDAQTETNTNTFINRNINNPITILSQTNKTTNNLTNCIFYPIS